MLRYLPFTRSPSRAACAHQRCHLDWSSSPPSFLDHLYGWFDPRFKRSSTGTVASKWQTCTKPWRTHILLYAPIPAPDSLPLLISFRSSPRNGTVNVASLSFPCKATCRKCGSKPVPVRCTEARPFFPFVCFPSPFHNSTPLLFYLIFCSVMTF